MKALVIKKNVTFETNKIKVETFYMKENYEGGKIVKEIECSPSELQETLKKNNLVLGEDIET